MTAAILGGKQHVGLASVAATGFSTASWHLTRTISNQRGDSFQAAHGCGGAVTQVPFSKVLISPKPHSRPEGKIPEVSARIELVLRSQVMIASQRAIKGLGFRLKTADSSRKTTLDESE
jgi:hypothetical protein